MADLMIPKPQHSNSMTSNKLRAASVAHLTRTVVMSATIEFDRELCRRAIEIEYVTVEWMLTTKLVACEISISQMAPKNALSIGCLLSQQASAIHEASL
jgi:hypothetical protein